MTRTPRWPPVAAVHLDVERELDPRRVLRPLHLALLHFTEAAVRLQGAGELVDAAGGVRLPPELDPVQVEHHLPEGHRHVGRHALRDLRQQPGGGDARDRRRRALLSSQEVQRAVVVLLAGSQHALGQGAESGVHRRLAPSEQDPPCDAEDAEEEGEDSGERRHADDPLAEVVHVAPEGELSLAEVEARGPAAGHRAAERERVGLGGAWLHLGWHHRRRHRGEEEHVGGLAELRAEVLGQAGETGGPAGEEQPGHRQVLSTGGGLQRRTGLADEGAQRPEERRASTLVFLAAAGRERAVALLPGLGLGQGDLELGRECPREVAATAGEGPGEDQPLGGPAHGDAGPPVADVDDRDRRVGCHLEPLGRGDEQILVGDGRVSDHPRVQPSRRQRAEELGQLLSPDEAHHEVGRIRPPPRHLVVEHHLRELEGQLALDLEGKGGRDALGVGEGQGEDVGRQRGPGQRHHHLIRRPWVLGEEHRQRLVERRLVGAPGLRVLEHRRRAAGGLQQHALQRVAPEVQPEHPRHQSALQ